MKRIALFADVQNIYYTSREAFSRQFDYRKLWQKISAEGDIVSAYAYAIARNDEGQQKFQAALRDIGFTVKLKPYIQRQDGSAKGDWDVGITIDMLALADQCDTAILLSGDGDFSILIDRLREHSGINVEVYGVASLSADSLKRSASRFHDIDHRLLKTAK